MPETLEFLSVNIWSVLMAIGNLLILFLIVKKFLFKPVNDILEKRAEEVDHIYSDAEQMRSEAKANKNIYEEKLKNVKTETDLMIKAATERAENRSEEIIKEATLEAENRKRKAEADILLAKKKAVDDIKDNIVEMVIDLAQQVVEKEINEDVHENLIDDAIEKLGERV
ncbi:MAG: F0F1 ATP synthase subunit B [Clostridiales bacterium]|jgi:F-type H+-transporting ATPase subunit b|nr:F0F1 ATP synthase subunit B [Clostridiales bacterium]